jgi:Tfp pilus assembly protein PilO
MNWGIKQLDRVSLAVIVVISLLCGYVAVGKVSDKKQQFRVEKEILSKRMKEVNLATATLKDLKVALDETKTELNYLNERIPESGKIGLFLRQIDALMSQRQIELVSIQPQAAIEEKNYFKIPIHLVFTGTFNSIYQLMRDIEEMNRIVIMDKMMIDRQENVPYCHAELMISVFEQASTY